VRVFRTRTRTQVGTPTYQVRTRSRLVVVALAALGASGATAACSLVSGLDQLQKVDCVTSCDDTGSPDVWTPDVGQPDAGFDTATAPDGHGTVDGPADAGDSEPVGDAAPHDAATASDAADAMAATDAADAGDASNVTDGPSGVDASDAGPTSAYAAAVLADMPLGYWRLGEASGATTCVDQTGHGYSGTVVGTITLGVPGALAHDTNTAAQFNGNGHIDVGNVLDAPSPAPFSWEVWVKPTSIGSYEDFISKMTYTASGNPTTGTYMFAFPGTGMNLGFERWVARASSMAIDTPGLVVGSWAHVVGTVDATGAGVLWVNGAVVGTGTTPTNVPATTAHLLFGVALPCTLDEIAVYDHVLSAQRVAAHYAAATQ
jgi:hypothetical protein